jgi:hypothetical protein
MKKSNYDEIIKTLQELKKSYPSYGMGRHLSTALSDYGEIWGLADKELLFALQKYQSELEYNQTSEADLVKIIEDGKNLDKLLKPDPYSLEGLEEEEEEY